MNKLKTFLIYILIILGFFGVSEFLSGQLIDQMYYKISGTVEEVFNYEGQELALKIEVLEAKATNVNGYMKVKVTNNTDVEIKKAYLKLDLFAKTDIKALSRYMKVNDLKPGEQKEYTLKFRAGYVDNYKVAMKDEFPDEDYIFEIFGYEINTKDFFGLDISSFIDAKSINAEGGINSIFRFFGTISHRFVVTAQNVPWWGYVGALAIIAGII